MRISEEDLQKDTKFIGRTLIFSKDSTGMTTVESVDNGAVSSKLDFIQAALGTLNEDDQETRKFLIDEMQHTYRITAGWNSLADRYLKRFEKDLDRELKQSLIESGSFGAWGRPLFDAKLILNYNLALAIIRTVRKYSTAAKQKARE